MCDVDTGTEYLFRLALADEAVKLVLTDLTRLVLLPPRAICSLESSDRPPWTREHSTKAHTMKLLNERIRDAKQSTSDAVIVAIYSVIICEVTIFPPRVLINLGATADKPRFSKATIRKPVLMISPNRRRLRLLILNRYPYRGT